MRSYSGWGLLGLAAVVSSGCVREAEIAVPSDLVAQTERMELTGLGGWERGQFQLGATRGRFTRHAEQRRTTDDRIENVGGGRFEAVGPEVGGAIAATCGFHESEIDFGAVTASDMRLAYGCEFERDRQKLRGGLLLREVPFGRGLLAGRSRAGELQVGALTLGIRAIHAMEGGAAPAGTPLGYAFDVGGRQIGAVDLNGTDKTIYAPQASGAEREAVLMASLALSIFWDPGD